MSEEELWRERGVLWLTSQWYESLEQKVGVTGHVRDNKKSGPTQEGKKILLHWREGKETPEAKRVCQHVFLIFNARRRALLRRAVL